MKEAEGGSEIFLPYQKGYQKLGTCDRTVIFRSAKLYGYGSVFTIDDVDSWSFVQTRERKRALFLQGTPMVEEDYRWGFTPPANT